MRAFSVPSASAKLAPSGGGGGFLGLRVHLAPDRVTLISAEDILNLEFVEGISDAQVGLEHRTGFVEKHVDPPAVLVAQHARHR